MDHTGWLPVLVRDGYNKTIFANPATIDLVGLLLKDSGHLQEEETQDAQKHKWSKHVESAGSVHVRRYRPGVAAVEADAAQRRVRHFSGISRGLV